MDERRRTPRASCRLHGRIRKRRGHVRVRIVDISEGGLCLFSPVALESKSKVEIEIDVPGFPDCVVQAEIWHVHRQKVRKTSRRIWAVGAMLEKSDDAYLRLLAAAGVAPEGMTAGPIDRTGFETTNPTSQGSGEIGVSPSEEDASSIDDVVEPQIFRVRVQARTGPRTRLLTLSADSRADAEAMAMVDLEPEWQVVEVLTA